MSREESDTITTHLELNEFAAALNNDAFNGLTTRTIVSLTSVIPNISNGDEAFHLPMLDMGLPVGPESRDACFNAVSALGVGGLLLQSVRSYHFIVNQPLSQRELTRFLARAQLLSPTVDARWASHQLIDGQCGLRISTDLDTTSPPHQLSAIV